MKDFSSNHFAAYFICKCRKNNPVMYFVITTKHICYYMVYLLKVKTLKMFISTKI